MFETEWLESLQRWVVWKVNPDKTRDKLSGRYHRLDQALAWIQQQETKVKKYHRAYLHPELIWSSDMSGDNEKVCNGH